MSREVFLALLVVISIIAVIFFLHTPPHPASSSNILQNADLHSLLLGSGSRVTLVSLSTTKADKALSQKQVLILSKPAKLLIAVAEPEGERLLAAEGKLFYLPSPHQEVQELVDAESRRTRFADSALSREEIGLGFQLARFYTAQEAGKAQQEGKEALVWQLSPKQEELSYPSAKLWVDPQTKLPIRIEFFNGAGELQRVVEFGEFVKFEGSWLANTMKVYDVLDGHSTELKILSRKSQLLFDLLFAPEQLKSLQFEPPQRSDEK